MFFKVGVLKNFANSKKKTCVGGSIYFIKGESNTGVSFVYITPLVAAFVTQPPLSSRSLHINNY